MIKSIMQFIIITILLFYPKGYFAQSFSLGTVANFVLFTSNGAISNTGTSSLIGNIGSDIGSIAGFGASTVIGSFYNSDVVTSQAKLDLFIAYNQLMSIPGTVTSHAPAFGSGEIINAGVYTILGAGSLADSLTLDGLGDTSAVFIFRFGGAYAVGAMSTVVLINGARSCNVFWVAEGAIALAASTKMKGTLLANNAAVSMAAGGELEGRMLSTTGAIAFGPATANLPTCGSSIPLPASPPCCNPEFGSTIDFVLFTNNGAVSNVGNSGYSRNIGSDMGVISGFATATVVGSFYNQDVVTEQTKIDLYELYNQLIINPITNNYHPPAFGNGETLTTGVYYIGGAGSLAGNLTLDAQGDTNSVFIFKIRGAFAAGANSNIILANLASSCSVFWVAEGAISIGASCQMKGTFLANNAAVSMADGGNLEGRLFSTNGAIAIDQTVADNTTPCHKPTYILPIELLSFNGKCNFQNIVLNWSTSTEINNNYFSIERSIDGINWQIIGLVNGAGNSNGLKNYTYTDDEPNNGISYYRLKQTDFNKTFKYSNIIYVENCKDGISELSISPNPVNEALNLSFYGDKNLVISMSIYNLLGEIIYFKKGYQSKIIFEEEINGVYFLHLSLPSKNIIKKFLTLN